MNEPTSIFLVIRLPNATTWFYFTFLLAVALFIKFSRLLSVRNGDIISLFLLMPGFLLLADTHTDPFWGYLWLLSASGYFFVRCLVDLALVRRPALSPNLSPSGLAWLAVTLYISLVAVAIFRSNRETLSLTGEHHPQEPPSTGQESEATQAMAPRSTIGEVSDRVLNASLLGSHAQGETRLWLERILVLLCHLIIVTGMILVSRKHFEDTSAGIAAATLYLLLPYTHLFLPGTRLDVAAWDHVWAMALLIWAVLAYRRPGTAGAILGLASGSVFFPVLTLPVWISFYWKRGLGRFLTAFILALLVCLVVVLSLLWWEGIPVDRVLSPWPQAAWQPWKPPQAGTAGIWQPSLPTWVYRIPIFLAYVAFMLTTAFWPTPKNLGQVLALSAALLIGIQFWYADRGGVYVFWYLPFLVLLIFRPNLSSCRPPLPPEDDWVARLARALARAGRRWIRLFPPLMGPKR
jgi:hypothetical protein